MYSTTSRLQLLLFIIVTSMSPASLSNELDWGIVVRQFSAEFSAAASVQRSATFAPSSNTPTMSSVIESSFPLRSQTFAPTTPTSFAPTSASPSAEPTSAAPESTSDTIPSQTQASSSDTGAGATTSQGSSTESADDSTSTGGGLVNGLGTTRSGGTLIVATTDAQGRTTTLRGADASSATRVIRTYTSALLGTTQRPLTYRTTQIVDGSTSVGEFTTSRPVTITTGTATGTNAAELAGGSDSGSSGLDAGDKKIVGGVVGGIGGALLIGFIIIALLRYRKRKNNRLNDDDYDDNDYNAQENKRISRGNTQILGDGLERYHNPASPTTNPPMSVNHSSNF